MVLEREDGCENAEVHGDFGLHPDGSLFCCRSRRSASAIQSNEGPQGRLGPCSRACADSQTMSGGLPVAGNGFQSDPKAGKGSSLCPKV